MKKIILLTVFILFSGAAFASISSENMIQSRVDSVGTNILNLNRIKERIVFVYNPQEKKKLLSADKTLTKRQIIVYDGLYQHVQTDDELAAVLSREVSLALKSYQSTWGGRIDSIEVFLSPKKYEMFADKRAVDLMIRAGYDPLALIVFINKTCPQKRSDFIARHNLASKRMARIYEYITYKYPDVLADSIYIENKYYQNFLLNSVENRRKLEEKRRTYSSEEIKYE